MLVAIVGVVILVAVVALTVVMGPKRRRGACSGPPGRGSYRRSGDEGAVGPAHAGVSRGRTARPR